MKPRRWLLSYDISGQKQRTRLAALATTYGSRVQKSVYICTLSPEQLEWLELHIQAIVQKGDRVMLRPICRACQKQTITQGYRDNFERHEPFWIV